MLHDFLILAKLQYNLRGQLCEEPQVSWK